MIWGLVTRRERWGLSWQGWLILFLAVFLTFYLCLFRIYPFLAITHRVNASVLVVEGWIHEYAIRAASDEFQNNHYERIFTTGGPVEGNGGYINDYQTSASVGADLLKKYGLTDRSVQMVPSRVMDRDRTYGSAIALRNWFRDHNMTVSGIDVVTESLHARRTQLLYQKAFGRDTAVGVIGVPSPDYDPRHWWHYSDGVREVLSESIAYIYARFLFFPSSSQQGNHVAEAARNSRSPRQ
ncbi:MAG TPA: ElyC/SanA/YdcF family protein [Candidatus Udaeobacter sp.]|nr:ElyC/SanA/YdcF family protein [Candidatus Udaeobacter sp.]